MSERELIEEIGHLIGLIAYTKRGLKALQGILNDELDTLTKFEIIEACKHIICQIEERLNNNDA